MVSDSDENDEYTDEEGNDDFEYVKVKKKKRKSKNKKKKGITEYINSN